MPVCWGSLCAGPRWWEVARWEPVVWACGRNWPGAGTRGWPASGRWQHARHVQASDMTEPDSWREKLADRNDGEVPSGLIGHNRVAASESNNGDGSSMIAERQDETSGISCEAGKENTGLRKLGIVRVESRVVDRNEAAASHAMASSPASRLRVRSRSTGRSRSQRVNWWSMNPAAMFAV